MLQLRHFQKAALAALEAPAPPARHVLCIAPTGSGKSLIYERAAAIQGRRTLLITPLVALARQQFTQLQKLELTVTLGAGGASQGPPLSESGAWIISPETLKYPSKTLLLQRWRPNLLVVDECHCLWDWGENFRPAFFLVPELLKAHCISKSIWLTATLPYEARLQLRKLVPYPLIELGQFDLPSRLRLLIQKVSWENRIQALAQWLTRLEGSGIVFVPTRDATSKIGALAHALGKKPLIYHGGMSAEERRNTEQLIAKKIPAVIVATSAFGMGMDYSHLKYVILWQAPTSILSLVQTIGRVGRNQQSEGNAIVLWDYEDFRLLEWTIAGSENRSNALKNLIHFLETPGCRRVALKKYFDPLDDRSQACLLCDYCVNTFT